MVRKDCPHDWVRARGRDREWHAVCANCGKEKGAIDRDGSREKLRRLRQMKRGKRHA